MSIKDICLKHDQAEIKKGPLPEVAEKILSNFYNQIKYSEKINQYLTKIPKGVGTSCPDSPIKELVEYVGMQSGNINKNNPDINLAFMKDIVMPAIEAEQDQVFRVIIFENKTDATPLEKLLIEKGIELSRALDSLWIRWFKRIVIPWQKLDESEREDYKKIFKNNLNYFEYTVFKIKNQKIVNRQTWAEAFPQEIKKIVEILKELSSNKLVQKDLILGNYIESLSLAYKCNKIDKLEEVWAKVDHAWIEISSSCRVFFVHGIENGYEHPACVSPDIRLVVRTKEKKEMIERFRKATIIHSKYLRAEEKEIQLLSDKLSKIDISVFVALLRGGMNANFRGSGQVAPNREDILAIGGKIFLDNESSSKVSTEIYKEEIRAHCVAGAIKKLQDLITPESMTLHTIIHECFHPIGITMKRSGILGNVGLSLEEGKATLGGILVAKQEKVNQVELLAITIARVCRFMHKEKLDNPVVASYVRENMIAYTTMFRSGVIILNDGGIDINLKKLPDWFKEIENFIKKITSAYQRASIEEIIEIEKEYCNVKSGSEINKLINWINRKSFKK